MVFPNPQAGRGSTADGAAAAPFARVKQHLKDGLAQGLWPPGAPMPSEAELVAHFGVSRMTVNRAMRELQAEGLVQRTQGVGTFAAPLHRVSSTLTIRDLHEEITARGHRHDAVVHLQQAEPAPAALAAQLGVAPRARVFHTLIVHHEDGVPLQCEDRYVNPACAPGYLGADFTRVDDRQAAGEQNETATRDEEDSVHCGGAPYSLKSRFGRDLLPPRATTGRDRRRDRRRRSPCPRR